MGILSILRRGWQTVGNFRALGPGMILHACPCAATCCDLCELVFAFGFQFKVKKLFIIVICLRAVLRVGVEWLNRKPATCIQPTRRGPLLSTGI